MYVRQHGQSSWYGDGSGAMTVTGRAGTLRDGKKVGNDGLQMQLLEGTEDFNVTTTEKLVTGSSCIT
jgi:hypothetical protein